MLGRSHLALEKIWYAEVNPRLAIVPRIVIATGPMSISIFLNFLANSIYSYALNRYRYTSTLIYSLVGIALSVKRMEKKEIIKTWLAGQFLYINCTKRVCTRIRIGLALTCSY